MKNFNEYVDKERVKSQLVAVAENIPLMYENIYYPSKKCIVGYDDLPVEVVKSNIKVTKLESDSKAGHIHNVEDRRDMDKEICIGVRPKWWNTSDREQKIDLLCHELTHIKYNHHRPVFWETQTRNLLKLYDRRHDLKPAFSPSDTEANKVRFNWNKVLKSMIGSINEQSVDKRMDTVEERREKVREHIKTYTELRRELNKIGQEKKLPEN
jgi:hypothetical protein